MSTLFTFHYILTLSASSDPTRHVEDFYDEARPGEGREEGWADALAAPPDARKHGGRPYAKI